MKKLILASKSPYRKALLERLDIPFETISSGFDENPLKAEIKDPKELTRRLSEAKAEAVGIEEDSIVLGSDQVCVFGDEILGKPGSIENAFTQLSKLSGNTHQLITSYALISRKNRIIKTNITTLRMRKLNDMQLKKYLTADNPVDCAGAYKLELKGISLMENIETTDHTAIMGLPLLELANDLNGLGFTIPSY